MHEKHFQKQVIKFLKTQGYYVLNIEGIPGAPDIVLCAKGKFIGIELKMPPHTKTPQQDIHLQAIKKSKGESYLLTYHKQWKKQLMKILK